MRTDVLADSVNRHGLRVIYQVSLGEYICFDAGNHDFLKRFPSDPPHSRMHFKSAVELREHLRLHGEWLRELQDTVWEALIELMHHEMNERKRRPARTAAARRKDAREKRD